MMHISEKQFRSEMASQKKLAELYEKKADQSSDHVEELNDLVRELEGQLENTTANVDHVKIDLEEQMQQLYRELEEKDTQIGKLQAELTSVNEALANGTVEKSNGVNILMFFAV
jgi:hypothetical protein